MAEVGWLVAARQWLGTRWSGRSARGVTIVQLVARQCRVKCQVIWSLVVGTAAASGEDWMDPG